MNFSRILIGWLLVLACALSGTAFASEPKPTLLVLDLQSSGIEADVARNLSGLLALEIERIDRFEIASQREMRAMLSVEEQKQLVGADEDNTLLQKIGERLQAQYLLVGQVGKVGNTYILSLTLLNVKTVKAERRVKQLLVGEKDGLIGSLRSAAVALCLQEKGVTPDISNELIRGLTIAEKSKTLFVHFRPGLEIPVGPTQNSAKIPYLLPYLYHVDVDLAYQAKPWLQVGLSSGFAFSIGARQKAMNKHMMVYSEDTNSDGKYTAATDLVNAEQLSVYSTKLDFSAWRIPFDLYARFQLPAGKFLPYALVGLGVSYNHYGFKNEKLSILNRDRAAKVDGACPTGYPLAIGDTCYPKLPDYYVQDTTTGNFTFNSTLNAQHKSINFAGLDFVAGAGFDYLFHENVGFTIEMKYIMVYALQSESTLYANFTDRNHTFTAADQATKGIYSIGDAIPVRKVNHGLMVNIGLTFYF